MALFVIVVAAVLMWVFVGHLGLPSVVCGGVVWGLGLAVVCVFAGRWAGWHCRW